MINKTLRVIRRFCSEFEKIENYDLAVTDMENMWDCHHRLEIGANGEVISRHDLIQHGLYYHRPPEELIFLLRSEHSRLHTLGKPSPHKGKTHSEETRTKMSESHKGKTLSEETRRKLREVKKAWWAKRKMVGK